jgi:hypothetical protein
VREIKAIRWGPAEGRRAGFVPAGEGDRSAGGKWTESQKGLKPPGGWGSLIIFSMTLKRGEK